MLLENGKLAIGDLREGARLRKELMEVRTRVYGSGRPCGADGRYLRVDDYDPVLRCIAGWTKRVVFSEEARGPLSMPLSQEVRFLVPARQLRR